MEAKQSNVQVKCPVMLEVLRRCVIHLREDLNQALYLTWVEKDGFKLPHLRANVAELEEIIRDAEEAIREAERQP